MGIFAATAFLFFSEGNATAQTADDGFKHFDNSIVQLPRSAGSKTAALKNSARQRKLDLHFALEPANQRELEARVARAEVVPADEMKSKYAGNEQSFEKLLVWLKGQGFQITQTTPDHANVYATASVAQIEKSLGVKMVSVTYGGQTTPAAVTAPKLPHAVGDDVISIGGLQPFVRAVRRGIPRNEHNRRHATDARRYQGQLR